MNRTTIHEALENCLRRLQAGEPLEQVVSAYPHLADELRGLLQTARALRPTRPDPVTIPVRAQNASRAKFLAAAGEARSASRRSAWGGWLPRLRLSHAALIVIIAVLAVALLGGGLVSAKALPGEPLYPVKIAVEQARLTFAPNPASRLALEERFDQERLEESDELARQGREAEVQFAGFLKHVGGGAWQVGSLRLIIPTAVLEQVQRLEGYYVEVEGRVAGQQVDVDQIQARLFSISGRLTSVQPDRWTVGDVVVRIDPAAQISIQPRSGLDVHVHAIRLISGEYLAVSAGPAGSQATVTYLPPAYTVTVTPALPDLVISTAISTDEAREKPTKEIESEPRETKTLRPTRPAPVHFTETPKPKEDDDKSPKPEETKKPKDDDKKPDDKDKTREPDHD